MGPRPLGRGNIGNLETQTGQFTRFNGATSSRTWKPNPPIPILVQGNRFNGATSSRTWKLDTLGPTRNQAFRFNGATSSRTWKLSSRKRSDK